MLTKWQSRNNGKFGKKFAEDKKQRNVRLTDEAWDNLESIAQEMGISRTDLIEILGRKGGLKQIVLDAIDTYLELCKQSHETNPTKKGEFSTGTRDFTHLMRFRTSVLTDEFLDPVDMLIEEIVE